MDPSAPLHPAGCPRCGARIADPYKYCPNCAYRLRPELTQAPTIPRQTPTAGQRVLALGGYLLFASLLLLVVLAGTRLFTEPEIPAGVAERIGVSRDRDVVVLDEDSFRRVEGDVVFWGLYDPERGSVPEAVARVDDPFRLAVHEVTNDQFYLFLLARAKASGEPVDEDLLPKQWTRPTGKMDVRRIYDRGSGNLPVTSVDYHTALEFCAWVWREVFAERSDIVVDLPTAYEYSLAARGSLENNFPWGANFDERNARLTGEPIRVDDERYPDFGGFRHLVGNAEEWVHGFDARRTPTAAGWSYSRRDVERSWADPEADHIVPFDELEFDLFSGGSGRAQVGFRVVVRDAPAVPEFAVVKQGRIRHVERTMQVLPPIREADEAAEPGAREDPVRFAAESGAVDHNFEIARTEITNRQYLEFLAALAPGRNVQQIERLIPETFGRQHPFWRDPKDPPVAVFPGHYGDPTKIVWIYDAGRDNHPVEGITAEQAGAYAAWLSTRMPVAGKRYRLPTAAEYLRAGRGDGTSPYPWGDNVLDTELVCAERAAEEIRSVSLLGLLGGSTREIVGLCGNLPEFVTEGEGENRHLLLAGGFYELPADSCTLDSFFDMRWGKVEWPKRQPLDEIERDVFLSVAYVFDVEDVDALGLETSFDEDLAAGPDGMERIVDDLQSTFDLAIPEKDAAAFRTIGDVVDYLDGRGGRITPIPFNNLAAYAGFRVVRVLDRF